MLRFKTKITGVKPGSFLNKVFTDGKGKFWKIVYYNEVKNSYRRSRVVEDVNDPNINIVQGLEDFEKDIIKLIEYNGWILLKSL